ncbi:MAG: neutral zinc metallopeptidase [Rhodobacteraceae bacterium]|nr:neutral zinc metallopeptidase [Paracoccaceae bacterium]
MEWRGRRGSRNIEDRRRSGGGRRGVGIGGAGLLIVLLLGWALGVDVTPLLQQGQGPAEIGGTELTAEDVAMGDFVSVTLADTEEVWSALFAEQLGQEYRPPTLVLFKGATSSPCGGASGATGPFYCPVDRKVYLDTAFFTVLEDRLGAGGDFAAAYVVAHEVGHHVQNELGILEQTMRLRAQMDEVQSNEVSVRVELMADCLAGVWAHAAAARFGSVERGDVEEAMNAAARIGDDTLQREAGRRPMPDSFTHGTSDQRMRWFIIGQASGLIQSCETFRAPRL